MLTTDSVILGVGIILVLVALVDMWQIRYENKMRDKRNSEGSGMASCKIFVRGVGTNRNSGKVY